MTDKIKEAMDESFRFRIGDEVALNTEVSRHRRINRTHGDMLRVSSHGEPPRTAIVLQRWVEECCGGIQLKYAISPGGESQHLIVQEFQLSPADSVDEITDERKEVRDR